MRRFLPITVLLTGLALAQTYRAVDVSLAFGSGPMTVSLSNTASPTLGAQKPTVKNGVAYVAARQGSGVWNVGLSPKLPLSLNVTHASGSQELKLRGLPLTRLNVKMGSGPVTMQLPAASFAAQVRHDSGTLDIHVPQNTGLRLILDKFESGALRVDGQEIAVGTNLRGTYQTSNYEVARFKVILNLAWGSGPVEVYPPGQ